MWVRRLTRIFVNADTVDLREFTYRCRGCSYEHEDCRDWTKSQLGERIGGRTCAGEEKSLEMGLERRRSISGMRSTSYTCLSERLSEWGGTKLKV